MTLMSSISELTISVDQLTGATNVTKSQLDAKVSQADAEVISAQAERAAIEGYLSEAAANAADAATHLATVKAGVNYQGISAILAEKAVTAVDVFVYDTSLDSDGGAWRKRCQHTSWFNEPLNTATRGARREFPAVAMIVVEVNRLTIYDGDDPSLPMWMVFNGYTGWNRIITYGDNGNISAASMLNGTMAVTTANAANNTSVNGPFVVSFIDDMAHKFNIGHGHRVWPQNIAGRNSSVSPGWLSISSIGSGVVGSQSNDVAMTVLADAPIDPATGLPVPTIAVATSGGVSVIKDNGTVVSLVNYVTAPFWVAFVDVGGVTKIFTTSRYENWVNIFDIPSANFNTGNFWPNFWIAGLSFARRFSDGKDRLNIGANNGVVQYLKDPKLTNLNNTSAGFGIPVTNYITTGYNTGWMPGNIKGAFLADTDDTDLVGAEMVTNGGFDTDSDWILGANTSISGGTINFNWTAFSGMAQQPVLLKAGRRYRLRYDVTARASGMFRVFLGAYITGTNSAISVDVFFTPSADVTNISFQGDGNGFVGSVDNFSIAEADHNRSVNNKSLIVSGTITRSPVADGAELVGYSGFSTANYLEGTDLSYTVALYALGWQQIDGRWEFKHGVVSAAPIDGLSVTDYTVRIAGTKPKALIRMTATTPTADQIAQIYEDERRLFQPGAACTLFGTSDVVSALAHDPKTNLLHVGTSQGRSVFDGFLRVAKTETPVGTAISAVNGLIAEQ